MRQDAIEIESRALEAKFDHLSEVVGGKKAVKSMRSAIRAALSVLRTSVRKDARKALPGSLRPVATRGVSLKIYKRQLGGNVNIMHADYYPEIGSRKNGKPKVFKLSWFELGTKAGRRYRGRKAYYHPGTAGKPFFKVAVNRQLDKAQETLATKLDKIIQKEATK